MHVEAKMFCMKEAIIEFIDSQTCASICCIDQQGYPYCFSCFYAFESEQALLYFKSSTGTTHAGILLNNPLVAGTILPDKLQKLAVKGIQFTGHLLTASDDQSKHASFLYHKKYPFALAIPGKVWALQLNQVKMTGGARPLGKKIKWERNHQNLS